jgi:type II secretory pathway pseudopilin PulG
MNFSKRQSGERGYILLALLLFVALLSIGIMTSIERIDFQIKRDREEEMIHRGVQYSRAIRHYFKKFGRYPTRMEDLENTNNMRFLRKRYKDPITGKPFKLLHFTDVQMSFNGVPPGVSVADMSKPQQGATGGLNSNVLSPAGNGPSGIAGSTAGQSSSEQQAAGDQSDSSDSGQDAASDTGTAPAPQPLSQQSGSNGAPKVFGGGAIVGVASISKEKSIREFNHKDHYNQWQFIYDPSTDRGGLLMTPNQPPLAGAVNLNQQQNKQGGLNGGSSNTNQAPLTPTMPPDQNQQ